MVERVTLNPSHDDIVINNGATEGAVDLFSYGPDIEPSAKALGSLYVVGWRQADTNTMGYMISLIAALARREYYAQPEQAPRDAFARTLHKINDVVEEFGKSSDTQLAVGIWAIAGSTVMTSRLDKFKLLLARNGEVIDIFNNVGLFAKDYVQKQQFSSVIHGTLQDGDRLLAYWPSKQIAAKERTLKTWLASANADTLKDELEAYGHKHPTFAASFVHVSLQQRISEATAPAIQPPELTPEPKVPELEPLPANSPAVNLAWSPRQHSGNHHLQTPAAAAVHHEAEQELEQEIPRIIPAEFSRGTRSTNFTRFMNRFGRVRFDTRGKAIVLVLAALIITGGVVGVKQIWLVSPQEKAVRAALSDAKSKLARAQTLISAHDTSGARSMLASAMTALTNVQSDSSTKSVAADITSAIDSLDSAQPATVSSVAQLDPVADNISLAVYSSTSASVWAVTQSTDGTSVVQIKDGSVSTRATLKSGHPDIITGFKESALAIDSTAGTITRIVGSNAGKAYTVPLQEHIVAAAVFADSLYVLTDKSILKISGLDTPKPVTKAWLADSADFASGAKGIWVDGNVYLLTDSGQLVTYYKGKRKTSVQTTVDLSGSFGLVPGPDGSLAVTNTTSMRASLISPADGSLIRTIKLDSQQPLVLMAEGPDGSILTVTKDNRIWRMQ